MDLLVAASCLIDLEVRTELPGFRQFLDGKSNAFAPSLCAIRPAKAISTSTGPVPQFAAIKSRFNDLFARLTREDDGYVVEIRLHNAATPQPSTRSRATSIESAPEMVADLAATFCMPQIASRSIRMDDIAQDTQH
jgi:hypothetical protein